MTWIAFHALGKRIDPFLRYQEFDEVLSIMHQACIRHLVGRDQSLPIQPRVQLLFLQNRKVLKYYKFQKSTSKLPDFQVSALLLTSFQALRKRARFITKFTLKNAFLVHCPEKQK